MAQAKPYTDGPEEWNKMFGSLFSLSETEDKRRLQLAEDWYKIIMKWYPDLHKKRYCVPPVHFNKVEYSTVPVDGFQQYGAKRIEPGSYSNMKSDQAQQRILWTLEEYYKERDKPVFILSNMEFHSYLARDYSLPHGCPDYPKPDKTNSKEEGDFDVLVIDKSLGVFVLEVKSAGGDSAAAQAKFTSQGKQAIVNVLKEESVQAKKNKPGKMQLQKLKNMMRKLLSDVDPSGDIKIRAGMCFPNVSRADVTAALEEAFQDPACEKYFQRQLCSDSSPDKPLVNRISAITFCKEDVVFELYSTKNMMNTDELFHKVDKVWNELQQAGGKSKEMDDKTYEQIVARFCGPLTTVKIPTEKCYPRVKLENYPIGSAKNRNGEQWMVSDTVNTTAGAARVMACRTAEIVLTKEQIDALQLDEDFVHLEGPPGTGKTILLLFRVLIWLEKEENMVWLVSLSPPSRSVTCVLYNQVVRMLEQRYGKEDAETLIKQRLKKFIQTRPMWSIDEKYYERRLLKFRQRVNEAGKKKVCLMLDESGMDGEGLTRFFEQVEKSREEHFTLGPATPEKPGFSVWSASVERVGRPQYVRRERKPQTGKNKDKFGLLKKLKLPLRCPPNVQKELMLAQPKLDKNNVCCFTQKTLVPFAADPSKPAGAHWMRIGNGIETFLINHGKHKNPNEPIWYCYDCGEALAKHLHDTLKIGEEECKCPNKPCIYEERAGECEADKCESCGKLTRGSLPEADRPLRHTDTMIIATRQACHNSIPLADFVLALYDGKFKVAVNVSREDGDAPIPEEDVILVTDLTSVHGLERAVIIIVPEAPISSETTASSEALNKASVSRDSDSSGDEEEDDISDPHAKSAILSMGPQCIKDFFYIGSRAVCHLILIHPGLKEPDNTTPAGKEETLETPASKEEAVETPARKEETMETD